MKTIEWIENDLARYKLAFLQLGLPVYMWPGVRRHLALGAPTGSFLQALFENNLSDAVSHGDDTNMALLKVWSKFFYNVLPSNCWGSRTTLKDWRASGGLYGIDAKAEKEGRGKG